MPRELAIDRAIYLVDDETRTYRFLKRNLEWQKLDRDQLEENKRQIDGFTRVFRDGSTKVFRYSERR
jgi:hypothetical protein